MKVSCSQHKHISSPQPRAYMVIKVSFVSLLVFLTCSLMLVFASTKPETQNVVSSIVTNVEHLNGEPNYDGPCKTAYDCICPPDQIPVCMNGYCKCVVV
ncbi:hypothetical protein Hanom_Chr11g01035911 [Helianthus anomalus]